MSVDSEDWRSIWERVRTELAEAGVDIEKLGDRIGGAVKVVCVTPDIKDSVDEMSKAHRDQALMVRVDVDTLRQLDEWVKTEAVKSRSEAAALFIREGLKVRASELEKLQDALAEVDRAKERLQEKVREVFGEGG